MYWHNVEKRFRLPSCEEEAHGVRDYVFGGWDKAEDEEDLPIIAPSTDATPGAAECSLSPSRDATTTPSPCTVTAEAARALP